MTGGCSSVAALAGPAAHHEGIVPSAVRSPVGFVGLGWAVLWLAVGCVAAALAAEPAEEPPPDWDGLKSLMDSGRYEEAAGAAAAIAKQIKPKRRAPDYLPAMVGLTQALMQQGIAELKLGRLDDADTAFTEAYRSFRDREFQRLVSIEVRRGKSVPQLVMLELSWIELLNLRTEVILERLRQVGREPSGAEPADDDLEKLRVQVADWLEELERQEKLAVKAREALAPGFQKGGSKILTSPRCQTLISSFYPALHAGVRARELAGLPFAVEVDGAEGLVTEAGNTGRSALVRAALERFKEARDALDAALAAALPRNASGLKAEQRIEAAMLQAELLLHEGIALLEAGNLDAARKDLWNVLDLQKEIATLRKRPADELRVDRLLPLLAAAEVAVAESEQHLADAVADAAREAALEASALLTQAGQQPLAESHPLAVKQEQLKARVARQVAALERSIPRSDAADAAARRLRVGIDQTDPTGASF
jgi:tetratricopeptide (TPR) repeat protein